MQPLKRLIVEEDGMEFLECSIVGAVVALAAIHLSGGTAALTTELAQLRAAFTHRWFAW